MSLLSKFISESLLKDLESEFVQHIPDMQQALLKELKDFADQVNYWICTKINIPSAQPEANEPAPEE